MVLDDKDQYVTNVTDMHIQEGIYQIDNLIREDALFSILMRRTSKSRTSA